MTPSETKTMNIAQSIALIVLRTLIGWHFLYEAYFKLMSPAWTRGGAPLTPWTSAGYLQGSSGPLGAIFHRLVNAGWTTWLDRGVKLALLVIGLSLILGLFTRVGLWLALAMLSVFYLLYVPTLGIPQPNNEGTYLIVNKTLIEAAAVAVLLMFDTGRIAGLDFFLRRRKHSS